MLMWHIVLLPFALGLLTIWHILLVRRHGVAPPDPAAPPPARARPRHHRPRRRAGAADRRAGRRTGPPGRAPPTGRADRARLAGAGEVAS